MKFSEYFILERPGVAMDPLGFMSPYANLQDTLFKQFTVLSNHPAYHGLLALVYRILNDNGIEPGDTSFALEFRKLEVLWGLANAAAEEGILNITKYKPLLASGNAISLKAIHRRHAVYQRLSYGTLGHYSSPSSFWGLTTKGSAQLSQLGTELADAFAARNGISLDHYLKRWRASEPMSAEQIEELSQQYSIGCVPGADERRVWQDTIEQYCGSASHTRCYWEAPLTHDELADFHDSPDAYLRLFPTLYERYPSLSLRFSQMEAFQLLAGLAQYVFEREYLTVQYHTDFPFQADGLEQMLTAAMGRLASQYTRTISHQDTKGLFKKLAGVSNYQEAAGIVVAHHIAHQRSKNVSPFLENGKLLVVERFHMPEFGDFREALQAAADEASALALLSYRYRRDWHFGRAYTYYSYAGLGA